MLPEWFTSFCAGSSKAILLANNPRVREHMLSNVAIDENTIIVQFNKRVCEPIASNFNCRKMFFFNAHGKNHFGWSAETYKAIMKEPHRAMQFVFMTLDPFYAPPSYEVVTMHDYLADPYPLIEMKPRKVSARQKPNEPIRYCIPSVGFVCASMLSQIAFMEIVTVGFTGSGSITMWEGHQWDYEQNWLRSQPQITML